MQLIGLTGGIAAGKSAVARRLAEHGAVHVDADALAREVVQPGTEALARIRDRFGDGVLATDGSLDRAALGAIVFADSEARSAVNEITHPAVWRSARERFDTAGTADPDAVVVYDVPLLVEGSAKRSFEFDLVVVVHADRSERIRRLVDLRGLDPVEAARRVDAQASDAERLAIADVVIDANGTLEQTLEQADRLWERVGSASSGRPD